MNSSKKHLEKIAVTNNNFIIEEEACRTLPKQGVLSIAKTRKYQIGDSYAAMISEEKGAGWSVFSNEHYQHVLDFFAQDLPTIEMLDSDSKLVIEKLWKSNLVYINNKNYRQTFIDTQEKKYPSYLVVKMTGLCNFACDYCYDLDFTRQKEHVDVAQVCAAIDFLLTKNQAITVVFHGGEPLLQFESIKKIVATTNTKLQQEENLDKKIIFTIQTNGALLSDEIIAFLETNNMRVGMSLDGFTNKANIHRRSHDGKTSSLDVFLKLYEKHPNFVKKNCGFLGVLHTDNIDEALDFIEWLQDLGVVSIYFNLLHLNNDRQGRNLFGKVPTDDQITTFYTQLIDNIKSGKINKIDAGNITHHIATLIFLRTNHICFNKGPCGAAAEFFGINNNGKFLACDCLPTNIGTIPYSELNDTILDNQTRDFVKETWNGFKNGNCKSCALFGLCSGGCVAYSYINSKCRKPDMARCIASKLIFKELFQELILTGKQPLLDYYRSIHINVTKLN